MGQGQIALEQSWLNRLSIEFEKPYMVELKKFLIERKGKGKKIFPPGKHIFRAFEKTPFDAVKVVILGQDPYHGPGQANGLAFSVSREVPLPPSLKNILKEIHDDLGLPASDFRHGCLDTWADQGVLLLNSVLTVEQNRAGSHQKKGWEIFTNRVIDLLGESERKIVFLLWGSDAQKKGDLVDKRKNLVLAAPHPSPLSAHRGFFGCKHFSKCNNFLKSEGEEPISWLLL
mgnify:FL=1